MLGTFEWLADIRRSVALLSVLGASLLLLPPLANAAPLRGQVPGVGAKSRQEAARIAHYWTPARMRQARPIDAYQRPTRVPIGHKPRSAIATASTSGVIDSTQLPYRAVGRIFLQIGRYDGYCSGSAINSTTRVIVLTAGHCVYDLLPHHRRPQAVRYLEFAPAYTNGQAPYGTFVAYAARVPFPWKKHGNPNFDMAAVSTFPNAQGQNVADAVGGGLSVAVNQPRAQDYHLVGYPGFDQQQMQECQGTFAGTLRFTRIFGGPPLMAANCFMAKGASGGPWLISGDTAIAGITTIDVRRDFSHTISPYFAGGSVGFLLAGL